MIEVEQLHYTDRLASCHLPRGELLTDPAYVGAQSGL